jgi:two-component system OmpR family sensor kinase
MSSARWSLARALRRRLLAGVALLWIVGAVLAVLVQRHETNEVLDSVLLTLAEQVPVDAAGPNFPTLAAAPRHEDVLHVLVRTADGRVLRSNGPPPPTPWPLDLRTGLRSHEGWRVATRRSADGQFVIQVGESMHERHEALAGGTLAMSLPLLALLPLAALTVHLLLRRSFRSIKVVGEQLRTRPDGDVSPVQADDLPLEFEPLIDSINALVQHLQGVARAERAFAASSAHELRTPVAAARAQAQRLAAELPNGDTRAHAQALVRSLERLGNTATKLLQLARVESGIALLREPVDLCQLATLVLDEFRHQADAASRLRLHLPDRPVLVYGDLDALGIAMRNLIENALKHAPGAAVDVRIEAPGNVVVTDDGPGVPAASLPSLLLPFTRGTARTDGTGLGLAIVSKIAQQQHARLQLESPPPDAPRGLRATLALEAHATG